MKLIEIRDELKKQYNDSVIIMKYGKIYRVFNEDTFIIHYIKNYKIHNNVLGFPDNIIENIKQELNNISVSYIIYNKKITQYKNIHNKYNIILKQSKQQYEKEKIIEQIKQLDINKLYEIINIYG